MAALVLWGCAGMLPGAQSSAPPKSDANAPATSSPAHENSARKFLPPSDLDRVLDANPQPFPAVKPAMPSAPEATEARPAAKEAAPDAGSAFRIQLDALSDMDAAQTRKAALEKTLGEKIDMVFDAPYYKLRFGNFATKQEAEDKLVDLAGKNLQGFIVR